MYLYEGSQENELQQYKISEKLWQGISAAFERAAKYIHAKGEYKAEYLMDKEVKPLIDETYKAFSEAVDYGLKDNEIPASMRLYLQDNVFVFSGFKTHTELRQASALLRDESGQIKPFNRFLSDIQKIDKNYNKTYLQAEYNFAVASSQAAARWQEIAEDGDDFLLQYRTAKDERVREQHRLLDGITLPPSDKFWDEFFPPNGWNCRCSAVQVNPKRYPESNSEEAIQRGRAATFQPNAKGQNKAQIFRFNPGKDKKIFPPKHPYYPKNCGNCQFNRKYFLAQNGNERNQYCIACNALNHECKIRARISIENLAKPIRFRHPIFEGKIAKTSNKTRKKIAYVSNLESLLDKIDILENITEYFDAGKIDRLIEEGRASFDIEAVMHNSSNSAVRMYVLTMPYQGQLTHLQGTNVVFQFKEWTNRDITFYLIKENQ